MKKCKIITIKAPTGEGNTHVLTDPNGNILPMQVWSRVYSGIHSEENYAIVKILIEIEPSKEIKNDLTYAD